MRQAITLGRDENNTQKLKIPYVNAALLVVRDIAKALAFDLGYKEYDGLTGLFEQSEMASEAVDELTGKLLSFILR